MLNESQKNRLVNKIMGLVRESIAENDYFENFFGERKEKNGKKDSGDSGSDELATRRSLIMKWLDTAQELHSVLAYELWPDKPKDQARSDFSKKYRGHDSDENAYHFDDEEINTLYNMRDDFIQRGKLDR